MQLVVLGNYLRDFQPLLNRYNHNDKFLCQRHLFHSKLTHDMSILFHHLLLVFVCHHMQRDID